MLRSLKSHTCVAAINNQQKRDMPPPTALPLTSAAQQLNILKSECHFGMNCFPEGGVNLG